MFFALDFDGVICDSDEETAASAWKCAWELWPELLKTQQIPEEMTDQFLRVRPYLETGWQSVLMLRMLLEKQPLSAFQNELEQNCQRLLHASGLDTESMIRKFAQSRDQWIQEDQQDWLNSHRFLPGKHRSLQKAMKQHEVRILTTSRNVSQNCSWKDRSISREIKSGDWRQKDRRKTCWKNSSGMGQGTSALSKTAWKPCCGLRCARNWIESACIMHCGAMARKPKNSTPRQILPSPASN